MELLQVESSILIKYQHMEGITAQMYKGTEDMMISSRIKDYKLLKMRLLINTLQQQCCPLDKEDNL